MRLVAGTVYALDIPFVEAFRHSAHERNACDSVAVRVVDELGTEGFGEGCPRPYVTGETVEGMVRHLARELWPAVAGRELPAVAGRADLVAVDALIPERPLSGATAANASRAALELAILDCCLRRRGTGLGEVLPPRRAKLVYSGVITAGGVEETARHARRLKVAGLDQVKVKVGAGDDAERLRLAREVLGPGASIRIDANAAWKDADEALAALAALAPAGIAAVEQPLPRGEPGLLAALRRRSPIPIMADESLLTLADAEALIAAQAVDLFNLRISKCGGVHRSLAIAERAALAGVRVQVGSQVGETAILSAAGRALAAHLPDLAWVEGSFGTLLLAEDVSPDAVRFGHRGEARPFTGPGLGVRIETARVERHARQRVELGS